jgi:Na+-transporting methylmalonyl-CoA/oxaloacetate decarboxylase gamma subunit
MVGRQDHMLILLLLLLLLMVMVMMTRVYKFVRFDEASKKNSKVQRTASRKEYKD